jgi:hypothetical protein
MNHFLVNFLQVIVALGLLNVWLIRFNKKTAYRGGQAINLKEEFAVYGLPTWFYYFIGCLKITSALVLILGLYIPHLTYPASLIIISLMIGAVMMHIKVKDSLVKTLPATAMLIMSTLIFLASRGF